jgi:uncharacterized protein (TIGR03118 family)
MRSAVRAVRRFLARETRKIRPRPPVRPLLEVLEDRCVPSADFVQTNLVSNLAGMAQVTDANLINPWGLTASPSGPFWVSNEGTGTSTLYNGQGQPQPAGNPLIVTIPTNPGGSFLPHGSPTGTVFNTSGTGFNVAEGGKSGSSIFLFDTLDGTISGWNPKVDPTHAIVEATNPGAVYTGLALGVDAKGDTLIYAANNSKGTIDVFNQNWQLVTTLAGNFTDPNLPSGYKPFNIQNIGGKLYVEYDKVDPVTHKTDTTPGSGIVDVFNTDGQFVQRLVTGGPLAAPWGVAVAPADFGGFANDLLVGNFGDGHINAFNAATGKFVGQLTTSSGQPFEEDHLWSLRFGNGGSAGNANTLFFTAGINGEKDGLLGSLQAVPEVSPKTPLVPNLNNLPVQSLSTVPANGDLNPYGLAFVPADFQGGGALAPGDLLVSNFNASSNQQATGSTIVKIAPDGQQSTFFQGPAGLGLTTALGVLPQGFVLAGSAPATTVNGTNTVANGGLIVLDSNGNEVMELSDSALLQGPWDLTVHNVDATHAQVFVSNVLSGTVTRLDLTIPQGGTPQVESETQIASGYSHRTDPNALVVGPTGLAFDAKTGTLYVSSTGDNAIYAIKNAATTPMDEGRGKVVVQDPQHLHGPLALVLAPNGDLIAANGDAVNPKPTQSNELVEYTPHGQFVGQFQIDGGAPGGAFGLAVQTLGQQTRFAAVDDNTNTVNVWTVQTQGSSQGGGNGPSHGGNDGEGSHSPLSPSTASTSSDPLLQQIDAFFQTYNADLQSLEASLLAMHPQLSGFFQMYNAEVDALEAAIGQRV